MKPSADLWNVLLGLAVMALAGVSAMGWTEVRELNGRVARLEGGGAGGPAPGDTPAAGVEQQVTTVNTSIRVRDSAFKGDPAARVVVIEFSDFECPFCARHFKTTLRQLQEHYVSSGKIKYVFRHFPLDEIHPTAFLAAEVAECSRRQGLFWEIHDQFFARPQALKDADLSSIAVSAGVEPARLRDCLQGSGREHVRRDVAKAGTAGVTATPFFFLGRERTNGIVQATRLIQGARPFEVFQAVIDELLRERGTTD